jgi:dTMP kinase
MSNGFYVVLEGAQGTGKTLQIDLLAKRLRAEGYPVRLFREPDSQTDLTAQAIRRLTQDPHYPMNTKTEVLLYNAARSQSLEIIRQAKTNGVICICDRNYLSTLAIEYYGRGDLPDYEAVNSIINFAVGDMQPDITIVLDAPADVLAQRSKKRGQGECFDTLDLEFLERVRAGYLLEARGRNYPVLLATEPPEAIHQKIWNFLHGQPIKSSFAALTKPLPAATGNALKLGAAATSEQTLKQSVISKNVSSLLANKLENEWPNTAGKYSISRIGYNQKDTTGKYSYFVPNDLNPNIKKAYCQTMDNIFDKYSQMTRKSTAYVRNDSKTLKKQQDKAWLGATKTKAGNAVSIVLPMAAYATFDTPLDSQALQATVIRLLADELPEAHKVGSDILAEARKINPALLKYVAKPNTGGSTANYLAAKRETIKKLAKRYLPGQYATASESVILLDTWPRNELDIVADMLYEHSDMPLEAIQKEVNGWSYKQKEQVFKAYMGERLNRRQKPGRALEKVIYNWDIFCEYSVFKDLMRHQTVSDMEWQLLTPRYGYNIPELIEKAGLAEQLIDCFDLSLELYSQMQKAGYELEAQYAVLRGHMMRFKVTFNARQAFNLLERHALPQNQLNCRRLAKQMHEKVLEVHPLIGEAMIFVDNDEAPESNRLAAERFNTHKYQSQLKKNKK